jgi:hypothetical protein
LASYIPTLQKQADPWRGNAVDVDVRIRDERVREHVETVLMKSGAKIAEAGERVNVQGDLGRLLTAALVDAEDMFYNRGEELQARYDMEPRMAMYAWAQFTKGLEMGLKGQKRFKEAAFVSEVIKRGVELSYNYYGVTPQKASERMGILTFSLVFYVIYTMWWGFAIFFLFEGIGLKMTKSKKQEG